MRRVTLIVGSLSFSIAAACLIGYVFFRVVTDFSVDVHQRSVTQELADWKDEYSNVSSHRDAIRTATMLEYIQRYYVPGEGYRGSREIEAALQVQRQETVKAFVAALRRFTGEDFGDDSDRWLEYLAVQNAEQSVD